MRKLRAVLVLAILAIVLWPFDLRPCTTFCFKSNGEWIFGRNYDFETEAGLIIVNKRGVAKTALLQLGTVGHAFGILDKCDLPHSKFRIVYDVKAGVIHFRTASTPRVRTIDFRKFDFACGTPVKMLDMLADLEGDVTGRFQDYAWEANYNLIKKAFSETGFLKNTPELTLMILARYPDGLRCQ